MPPRELPPPGYASQGYAVQGYGYSYGYAAAQGRAYGEADGYRGPPPHEVYGEAGYGGGDNGRSQPWRWYRRP